MDIKSAQENLRASLISGAPGVMVSGFVWIAAGLAQLYISQGASIGALLIGGMLIYPLGTALSRLVFRAPATAKDNPLNTLGIEATVILFAGIFLGYAMLFIAPTYFFPVIGLVVGARYFVFSTMYGEKLYWGLGGLLMALCVADIMMTQNLPLSLPLAFGGLELLGAVCLFIRDASRR